MLDFAHQHGLRAAEVEQQHVALAMLDADAHAMRLDGVVGAQHVTVDVALDPVDEIDALILAAHVHMVAEHPVDEKFHAYTRGEVE